MKGVRLTPLRKISTEKGDVRHALKRGEADFKGFGEVYFSEIFPGDQKGWKRHNRITLNLVVVVGQIRFTILDQREGSDTYNQREVHTLSVQDNYARLSVDPGLWMMFEGLGQSTSVLMDLINEEHDPSECDRRAIDPM